MSCHGSETVLTVCLDVIEVRAQWRCRLSVSLCMAGWAGSCLQLQARGLTAKDTHIYVVNEIFSLVHRNVATRTERFNNWKGGMMMFLSWSNQKKKTNNSEKPSEQMLHCKDKWTGKSLFAFRSVVDVHMLLCYRREGIDPQRIFRWLDVWLKIFVLLLLLYPSSKMTHGYF